MTPTTPLQRLTRLDLSTLLLALVGVGLLTARPGNTLAAEDSPPMVSLPGGAAALPKAVLAMEQLDQMRISMASTLEGRTEMPTVETMKEVCKPVGMRAIAIGKENGWQERQVVDLFSRHPEINGLWEPAVAEQGAGLNYYRRINVEPSCLACHGTKASRQAFIKDNYLDDKAFAFKVGDLRGMYAVYLPEVKEAISQAME